MLHINANGAISVSYAWELEVSQVNSKNTVRNILAIIKCISLLNLHSGGDMFSGE
jgi:hypothetical protein